MKEKKLNNFLKSKYITSAISIELIKLGNKRKEYYIRCLNCCSVLVQEGNELQSKYCNSRYCLICNRIRTAKMINKYAKQFEDKQFYFVTLTVPNVPDKQLNNQLDIMLKNFNLIKDCLRKRGYCMNGLRKLEITYNFEKNNYHPHYHFLCDSEFVAVEFIKLWCKKFPKCSPKYQNIKKCTPGSIKEIFKYTTKVLMKSKKNNKFHYDKIDGIQENYYVNIKALDKIIEVLFKRRTFQPFGYIKCADQEVDELETFEYVDLKSNNCTWFYNHSFTGLSQSGYINEKGDVLICVRYKFRIVFG